jgi:hypothetical protein
MEEIERSLSTHGAFRRLRHSWSPYIKALNAIVSKEELKGEPWRKRSDHHYRSWPANFKL